ncbi:hypothetical protein QQ045_022210 [Rhodiola kirilowii]
MLRRSLVLLKKAWLMPKGVVFEEIPGNMVVIKFDEEAKIDKVMEEGPWTFQNQLILIKRWELGRKPHDLDFSKAQLWIQIHNIPFEFMTDKITSGVAERIGRICKMSRRAINCVVTEENGEVRVNTDEGNVNPADERTPKQSTDGMLVD